MDVHHICIRSAATTIEERIFQVIESNIFFAPVVLRSQIKSLKPEHFFWQMVCFLGRLIFKDDLSIQVGEKSPIMMCPGVESFH